MIGTVRFPLLVAVALLAGALGCADATKTTMNAKPTQTAGATELATLGGGCFWCVEAVFELLEGVVSVKSGYAGGQTPNPTYKQVCGGDTGHAEVVQIEFDPARISYSRLLEVFWDSHDPTTLNRQGADSGTQYRSVILFHNDTQRKLAETSKAAAQKNFSSPIVTEIVALEKFHVAEVDHQDYFRINPSQGYCRIVIAPKVEKMKKKLGVQP